LEGEEGEGMRENINLDSNTLNSFANKQIKDSEEFFEF
jgi:hypothetical protein